MKGILTGRTEGEGIMIIDAPFKAFGDLDVLPIFQISEYGNSRITHAIFYPAEAKRADPGGIPGRMPGSIKCYLVLEDLPKAKWQLVISNV
jgi:hypothetical protein